MKRSLFIFATLASVASIAYGQSGNKVDYTPSNVTLRLGGGFAIDQSLNSFSTSYFGAGVDFGFSKGLFKNSEMYYSIDYLYGSHRSTDAGFLPVSINHRFYTDHGSSEDTGYGQRRLYAIGGIGFTYYQVGGADIKPSLKLGFGTELNENLTFESNVFLAQKSKDDVTANLVAFYIGYHFR